jgi:DnaJ-class molecular chaperone
MIIADRKLTVNAQGGNAQAYRELLAILKKPYQDVCRSCGGSGKTSPIQACQVCRGTGNRWLRLI